MIFGINEYLEGLLGEYEEMFVAALDNSQIIDVVYISKLEGKIELLKILIRDYSSGVYTDK